MLPLFSPIVALDLEGGGKKSICGGAPLPSLPVVAALARDL